MNTITDVIANFIGKMLSIFIMGGILWFLWNKVDGGTLFGLRSITWSQSVIVIVIVDIIAGRFGVNDKDNK